MWSALKRLTSGTKQSDSSSRWREHFPNASFEDAMNMEATDRFHAKQGRSTCRIISNTKHIPLRFYLKRHYQFTLWQRLKLYLKNASSPARQEVENLKTVSELGILAPRVLAYGERIGPGLKVQSYLAIEELVDMLPLHEAIPLARQHHSAAKFLKWKRRLIEVLANLTYKLHEARLFHKDLYLCHVYLHQRYTNKVPADFSDLLHMIDFGRLKKHTWLARYYTIKDLAQLAYSTFSVDGINLKDMVHFLHDYFETDKLNAEQKKLCRAIAQKALVYQKHNEKKRKAVQLIPVHIPQAA